MQRSTGESKPPAIRRDALREILHGVEVSDPYRWLGVRASREGGVRARLQGEQGR
jgi:hypothetical protein